MARTKTKLKNSGNRKFPFTKRLQTELQSLVAYGAYDSPDLCGAGTSMTQQKQIDTLQFLYFPSNNENDNRMSHVDLFLKGKNKYKYMFSKFDDTADVDDAGFISEDLHRMPGKVIYVGQGCITRSVMTRKNLTNNLDISGRTLYSHAKEVEKNMKKALAICKHPNSPYKDYHTNGYPSGHNWNNYIEYVRKEMYKEQEKNKKEIIDVDEPDDDSSNESQSDDVSTNLEKLGDDESSNDDDSEKSFNDNETAGNNNTSKQTNNTSKQSCSNNEIDIPDNEYFKGFIAFILWGFIQPIGGEAYQSLLMLAVDEDNSNPNLKNGTRKNLKNVRKNLMI